MIYRTWGDRLPFAVFIALSCVGTLALAAMSWHLVEKPFMRMKKRPSRTVAERRGLETKIPAPLDEPVPRPPLTLQRQVSLLRQVIFFV